MIKGGLPPGPPFVLSLLEDDATAVFFLAGLFFGTGLGGGWKGRISSICTLVVGRYWILLRRLRFGGGDLDGDLLLWSLSL